MRRPAALLLPLAAYLAAVALLGDWVVDDAGISFAYARNVAAGWGFVAQPGAAPVEGFSNFLWVLAWVPIFLAHAFDAVVTTRVVAGLLMLGAFAIVDRTLREATGRTWTGIVASVLVATSAPIVIWTASGLENGLLLVLALLLWGTAVLRPPGWPAVAGALAGLLAMTRPDGLVYAAVGPLVLVADAWSHRGERSPRDGADPTPSPGRRLGRDLAWNVGAFLAVFGPFLVFRLATFGLPWPHPYYAKRVSPGLAQQLAELVRHPGAAVAKAWGLVSAVGVGIGPLLVLGALGTAGWLASRRALPRALAVAGAMAAIATGAFVLLDDDWMGEYRFGTVALGMILVAAAVAAAAVGDRLAPGRPRRLAAGAGILACVALVAGSTVRVACFASNPTTPLADIRRLAARFDGMADRLGLQAGSILLPDIGGMLLDSRLQVVDAAGLVEPRVVDTLKEGTPIWLDRHPRFFDWVFEQVRPTFIRTQKFWTRVTAFDDDPRFARDYVAIDAFPDPWVRAMVGRDLHGGEFVRRDALPGRDALETLRSLGDEPRPEPWVRTALDHLQGPEDVATLRREFASLVLADPDGMVRRATRAIAGAPADLDLAWLRATALDAAFRSGEARPAWTRLLREFEATGDEARAIAVRDRLHGSLEPPPDAAATAEQAARMESAVVALHRGGRPEGAVAPLRQILEQDPAHYGATYQLALALDRVGNPRGAQALWERVLGMARRFGDEAVIATATRRLAQGPVSW